jgi:hypothetical protein
LQFCHHASRVTVVDPQSSDQLRRSFVGIVIADRGSMPLDTSGLAAVLACLWELSDGTRAFVVEHRVAPRWELRMVRRGSVVDGRRFHALDELMAKSLAEYRAATEW